MKNLTLDNTKRITTDWAPNTWQPIKTAPKDGTTILLYIEEQIIEGGFVRDEWRCASLSEHGCGCCSDRNDDPTHWMPLPKPPLETKNA